MFGMRRKRSRSARQERPGKMDIFGSAKSLAAGLPTDCHVAAGRFRFTGECEIMWPVFTMTLKRCAVEGLLLLALTAPAPAQAPVDQRLDSLEKQNAIFRQQVEELRKQNQQLLEHLKTASPTTGPASTGGGSTKSVDAKEIQDHVNSALRVSNAEKDTKKKAEEAEQKLKAETEGYRIGAELTMKANWADGVVFSTPRDDFTLHVGGWMHYDNVWWRQSPNLRTPQGGFAGTAQNVLSGARLGGINDLQDGTSFRRIRFLMDGKFWENYEYNLILALENDQFNTIGLDEFWVGATNIPVLGTVRAGHVKAAHGLEADMTGSSRAMTFMERSSYSEAIENNINFVTGLWLGNNYFDQRATWSTSLGRADLNSSTGAFFGDGQYIALGRLTALPLYESDGRHLLHVGASGGFFKAQNNLGTPPVAGSANHQINLQARPELRDDVPAGGFQETDNNRMLATGNLVADHEWNCGAELLYIRGPLSLQAEYGFAFLENVAGQPGPGITIAPTTVGGLQNYVFSGGYVQLAYTLTGENRAYDKRLGRLDTYYFGRNGPFTNAWFLRDESGNLNWGLGAWEIAARYSYLNLNDGTNLNRIQGGQMDGMSLGLNWFLNTNLKAQFDYVYNHRYNVPTGPTAATGTIPGYTSGFGIRLQYMW
jgi:phosphate-selective porin OprO and OprP